MIIETTADLITETPANGMIIYTIGSRIIGAKSTVNSIEEAQEKVEAFWNYEQSKQFVWGDFVNDCSLKFGEAAAQIIPITHNAPQTIANWASICAQYERWQRAHDVSFTHYAAVAYITDHAKRDALLAWAAKTDASVEKLKEEAGLKDSPASASILNDNSHSIELDVDTVNQIRLGNLRGVMAIFKSWRGIVQADKRYRIILQEVND